MKATKLFLFSILNLIAWSAQAGPIPPPPAYAHVHGIFCTIQDVHGKFVMASPQPTVNQTLIFAREDLYDRQVSSIPICDSNFLNCSGYIAPAGGHFWMSEDEDYCGVNNSWDCQLTGWKDSNKIRLTVTSTDGISYTGKLSELNTTPGSPVHAEAKFSCQLGQ